MDRKTADEGMVLATLMAMPAAKRLQTIIDVQHGLTIQARCVGDSARTDKDKIAILLEVNEILHKVGSYKVGDEPFNEGWLYAALTEYPTFKQAFTKQRSENSPSGTSKPKWRRSIYSELEPTCPNASGLRERLAAVPMDLTALDSWRKGFSASEEELALKVKAKNACTDDEANDLVDACSHVSCRRLEAERTSKVGN